MLADVCWEILIGLFMTVTNNKKSESSNFFKWRRFYFEVGCLTFLLAMPILLYFGYCWGLLGRHSLLLQYLIQCKCPAISVEARYPENVDVIVSACSNTQTYVNLSPSGRLLYIQETNSETTIYYLLDLQTRNKIDIRNQGISSFLTDDLWFLRRRGDEYVIDRITGVQYSIEEFVYSRPNAQIDGNTNLTLLTESLKQADQVFLIGPGTDEVVALASNFEVYPGLNFIVTKYDVPYFDTERFLQENGVPYQTVLPSFPGEVVSPNGKLVARGDGIYIVSTGEKIVEGFYAGGFYYLFREYYSVRGWLYDGSGVIYSKFLNPCVIEFYGCSYEVPQPVILLKVPEEYLLSSE